MRRLFSVLFVVASFHASAADKPEKLAVVAVAPPFGGPGPALAQMSRELRAACAERTPGVMETADVRARMLGPTTKATLPQLDRAYSAVVNMGRNGEDEVAFRTLFGIVEDLERMPEGAEVFGQWIRAMLRLSYLEDARGHKKEAKQTLEAVLAVQPAAEDESAAYPAPFLQLLERTRVDVNAKRHVQLSIQSNRTAIVSVNGRPYGNAPVTITLPPGRYRIGGLAGKLRAPALAVELRDEPETVNLDFTLADAFRPEGGPGLALSSSERAMGIVRTGAWLGADRVLAATTAREGGVEFLVGTLYDVRRGAVQREAKVRVGPGGVPPANMAMLVKFLFTGERGDGLVAAEAPTPVEAKGPIRLEGKGGKVSTKGAR